MRRFFLTHSWFPLEQQVAKTKPQNRPLHSSSPRQRELPTYNIGSPLDLLSSARERSVRNEITYESSSRPFARAAPDRASASRRATTRPHNSVDTKIFSPRILTYVTLHEVRVSISKIELPSYHRQSRATVARLAVALT